MSFLSKTDTHIFRALKIILAACLLTPLLAWSLVIFPYTAPKAFIFRILVEIAAVFYFYLVLKYPANFFTPLFKGGRGGILNLSVLVFLLISFLSAIFGADFYTSWWGNLERMIGVWGLLHFVAFFFLLSAVFRVDGSGKQIPPNLPLQREEKNKIPPFLKGGEGGFKDQDFSRQLMKISVAVSAVISLLAICQHFFSLGDLLPQVDRVSSTLGNAGFLGTYLIFNIFLAGYLLLSELVVILSEAKNLARMGGSRIRERSFGLRPQDDKRKYFRSAVYCLLLIVNCLALLLSGTRGAYLGLGAGIIVFLVLIIFMPTSDVIPAQAGIQGPGSWVPSSLKLWRASKPGMTKKKKQFVFLLLVLIFILIGSLFLFRNSGFVKNNPTLSRLTSISLSDTTAQSRLILWQGAWQAWQEKPLFGFGPENFEVAISKYLSPRLANYEAYGTDRAHNFIFDYGVAIGWLGLLSYLAIFGAAGWGLIKNFCHSERSVGKAKNLEKDPSAWRPQDDRARFLFSTVFLSLLAAYLVQNFFIFDSFISYLMLFFILAMIAGSNLSTCEVERLAQNSFQPPFTKGGEKQNPPLFKGGLGGIYLPWHKKLILFLFVFFIIFSLYSFNFKPLLAAHRANQILSLPSADAAQSAPLLEDALDLGTFGSAEAAYQAALDYIIKINRQPALAQNEEFYNIAAGELSKIIERSPNRARNYVVLAWLNLYFSNQHLDRINESISLAGQIMELSPTKKDAYLILVAGYSLSGQTTKAQEVVSQAESIDVKMGEEVRSYYEKLK